MASSKAQEQSGAPQERAAALFLAFAAVVVLAMSGARLGWAGSIGAGYLVEAPAIGAARASGPADLSVLATRSPFRTTSAANALPPSEFDARQAPQTELELILHGIFANSDQPSSVIVSRGSGPQLRYRVGDQIDGMQGVSIARVFADGILISRDGRSEWLPKLDSDAEGIRTIGGRRSGGLGAAPGTSAPPVEAGNAFEVEMSADDLRTLATSIRLAVPERPGIAGVAIYPAQDPSLFQSSGLVPGDVVTALAGRPVASEADLLAGLAALGSAETIEIALMRGEQRRLLTVRIKKQG